MKLESRALSQDGKEGVKKILTPPPPEMRRHFFFFLTEKKLSPSASVGAKKVTYFKKLGSASLYPSLGEGPFDRLGFYLFTEKVIGNIDLWPSVTKSCGFELGFFLGRVPPKSLDVSTQKIWSLWGLRENVSFGKCFSAQ